MKKVLIYVILLAFILGCQRSTDPAPITKTAKEYLTAHGWICTKYIYNNVDYTDVKKVCELDNIHTFKVDGSYEVAEGERKCNPTDSNVFDYGEFSLSPDGKMLYTTSVDETVPTANTIKYLDDNTFNFSFLDTQHNYYINITYSKK